MCGNTVAMSLRGDQAKVPLGKQIERKVRWKFCTFFFFASDFREIRHSATYGHEIVDIRAGHQQLGPWSSLCSDHFKEDCIDSRGEKLVLKPGSASTDFNIPLRLQPKQPSSRRLLKRPSFAPLTSVQRRKNDKRKISLDMPTLFQHPVCIC